MLDNPGDGWPERIRPVSAIQNLSPGDDKIRVDSDGGLLNIRLLGKDLFARDKQ